ncbi:B-cell receptor-associated 31-like protein [Ascodesmis nigricans]|uniref:Endoplasmic reticulum transmembrane protein n=1 Tax=Ascodesmis nigricans TaxID=341454 RepID=A0A4S2N2Z4_9PEZI|nr:B-cell receptor-associated 31-like protein [Ascodesmis nigricans]
MTLYYTLVFFLLVTEMSIFMLLIFPLPFTWRKKIFEFISTSPVIAKLQYGMKITFIFILILFIDSVNRVYRVQREISDFGSRDGGRTQGVMGHERMEVQARKFYSQRNMYLCGFTLFLSLILNRTYTFILDILRLEEQNKQLRATAGKGGDSALLLKKDQEIKAIKAQAEGLSREYNELSDRYERLQKAGQIQEPKKEL